MRIIKADIYIAKVHLPFCTRIRAIEREEQFMFANAYNIFYGHKHKNCRTLCTPSKFNSYITCAHSSTLYIARLNKANSNALQLILTNFQIRIIELLKRFVSDGLNQCAFVFMNIEYQQHITPFAECARNKSSCKCVTIQRSIHNLQS